MERTTDLGTIRNNPRAFSWGHVDKIYDIDDYYTIVQYTPMINGKIEDTHFHVYVDGKDTSRGSYSIEGAMILAIALGGFENKNTAAELARAAAKLLEVDED